jgi:hypothetical protein
MINFGANPEIFEINLHMGFFVTTVERSCDSERYR